MGAVAAAISAKLACGLGKGRPGATAILGIPAPRPLRRTQAPVVHLRLSSRNLRPQVGVGSRAAPSDVALFLVCPSSRVCRRGCRIQAPPSGLASPSLRWLQRACLQAAHLAWCQDPAVPWRLYDGPLCWGQGPSSMEAILGLSEGVRI
ncbi:uncharacterized protein LOC143675073 [Tamandua tetradactyla]|uniref:uncharacterized protein LOC143675073 n=1 Tax=Tamandua tetradactyla TaxID=48850 RepID=UPI00405437B0